MAILTFILYAAAATLYGLHFAQRRQNVGLAATAALAAAVLAHTFVLGVYSVHVGHLPIVSRDEAVSAFVWLLALTYLYLEMTTNERAMGAFIAPLLALLFLIPMTSHAPVERPALLDSPLFAVHAVTAMCAYAAFALAAVVSITYILLFRELKRKQPGVFFARLPPLRALDVMNLRAITVGLIFLTIAVIAGVVWIGQARVYAPNDPRVQAMSLTDPKISVALVSLIIYAFQIYARRILGWGGWRAAWLSTIGFASVLVNLLIVAYLVTTSHSFD